MNKRGKISASLMCSDLKGLENILKIFEENKIEFLHMDIMDGEFVPNLGLGIDYIRGVREITNIPMDFHLMVNKPEKMLEWLPLNEGDQIAIHYESCIHIQRTLQKIKELGCKAFIALNPATPIIMLEDILPDLDGVLILTVNPGFAGQKIVKSCIDKTRRLKKFLIEKGYPNIEIEVDGNITNEYAKILKEYGANIFVAGTSSIFKKDKKYNEHIKKLYENIQNWR